MTTKRRPQKGTRIRRSRGGEQLRNIRRTQGRVAVWCAKQVGVDAAIWSKWETGVLTPGDEQVARIAALFAVPITALDMLAGAQ